ncbi:MAG: deoxynucleoside kinase [Myxococcales bacterium]|nr:deoxynucleoside kinase [Myxococcales bacterium]MCB9520502.1 deoxynucleoside kinase [Myxococcales bacterium]
MSAPKYIVVEGVIGVGKTTLVGALARRLDARTVYEVFEENPFLEGFYRDRARFAFSTEMFFLLSRFRQQEVFAQEDLLQSHSVSDYLFAKCRLFASVTLSDAELALFDDVYAILHRQCPRPDLVVYLHAPVDVLVGRIRERARDYERDIDPAYLAELSARYVDLFAHYDDAPVLSVDTSSLDFRDDAAVDWLISAIRGGARGRLDTGTFTLQG